MAEETFDIFSKFETSTTPTSITPFGGGWINTTLKVTTTSGKEFILQKINHQIFKNVDMLQSNIERVTTHIRKKLMEENATDIDCKVLHFYPCKETGKTYYYTGDAYWRTMDLIADSQSFDAVTPELSYVAGKAFGDFQCKLADIPGEPLGETIPNFHNMEFRLQQFHEALAENKAGRAESVKYFIDEIEKRAEDMCKAERLYREGKLPKRINHCDTKVNNILFDKAGNVLCVIDLDTVMPGYVLSDFGDFIRTGANTGAEDDANLDNVNLNMEIFKAYTKGYLETAKKFLLPIEIENLPFGAKLLTYMQTVRFLTDYLNGDTYYKTMFPGHNLQRTKAQFKLVQSIEANEALMNQFIKEQL
ncbi:MAG: aminoglycoside phosphotransferase family protein [Bacteroidales bacterium]|nr:aminoglycoside phosphotransferase family protein [Bacteroidales bacterium]